MAYTTDVSPPVGWTYLVDLIVAARAAQGLIPLPQTTAFQTTYRAATGNDANKIEFTTDPKGNAVAKALLAEESFEEFYDHQTSLRNWYVRTATSPGNKLIVTQQS